TVAGLGRSAVAEVVGQDDEVTRRVERPAGAEQLGGEQVARPALADQTAPLAAGAVQDEDGVADHSLLVPLGRAHGPVMDTHFRQLFAGRESEVPECDVAVDWCRKVRRDERTANQREEHDGDPDAHGCCPNRELPRAATRPKSSITIVAPVAGEFDYLVADLKGWWHSRNARQSAGAAGGAAVWLGECETRPNMRRSNE